MTIDLTSIANAVIALIAAIITAFVIPWIRSKTTAAQFEKIKMWVTVAVEAAEQLYTGSGRGAEKKAYVVEFLNSKGFKIDAETLDKLIEAAVFNLPDYFTVSGIPGYRQQQRVIDRAADRASPFSLPPHKEQSPVRAFEPCTGDFFVWFIPSAVRPTLPTARQFSL